MTRSPSPAADPRAIAARAPARRPATWPLPLLVVGHVVVAVGVVVLVYLLVRSGNPAAPVLLGVGLAALVLGQVLSTRRLLGHLRALARDRRGLGDDAAMTGARRLELPAVLAVFPFLFGTPLFVGPAQPPPGSLFALLCALCSASLVLDHAHGAWIHRHLDGRGPRVRTLPAGSGHQVRRNHGRLVVLLALFAAIAVLLGFPVAVEPLLALVPSLAAFGVALLALLLIRAVRGLRRAIRGDEALLPDVDDAVRSMRRLGPLAAGAAVLTVAALAPMPTTSVLAVVFAMPLVLVLYAAGLELGYAIRIDLGDPRPAPLSGARRSRSR